MVDYEKVTVKLRNDFDVDVANEVEIKTYFAGREYEVTKEFAELHKDSFGIIDKFKEVVLKAEPLTTSKIEPKTTPKPEIKKY